MQKPPYQRALDINNFAAARRILSFPEYPVT